GEVFQAVGAALVPGDDVVVVRRLDDSVEGVVCGHVPEGGGRRRVDRPALRQHYYLGKLGAGGHVVGLEGAVLIPGNDPVAVQVAHRLVEVVSGGHVCEVQRAGCVCGAGRVSGSARCNGDCGCVGAGGCRRNRVGDGGCVAAGGCVSGGRWSARD